MTKKTYRVFTFAGDGIGPEIVEVAIRVLKAVEDKLGTFSLELQAEEAGAAYFERTGENISEDTVQRIISDANAILKGPAGLPHVRTKEGTEAGILGSTLRVRLDMYVNVRPVKLLPGVSAPVKFAPGEIDYVIVRENTEGLYASRDNGVANRWAASDQLFLTRPGTERIIRKAFDLARTRNGAPADHVRRVTCVDKSNVLKTMAFWRQIFSEVAKDYPDIEADYIYSDACGQALVMEPGRFDVLVMENFLGDLLSDVGGGTVGGIGMCPSGNIGDTLAFFEPAHGSAPTIAGKNLANPIAEVLSAAMMLDWLGEGAAAREVERAVNDALTSGDLKISPAGTPEGGTEAAGSAIVAHV